MYRHTQTGWFIIVPLAAALVMMSAMYFEVYGSDYIWVIRAVFIVVVLCLLIFYNLTVAIEGGNIYVGFSFGLIKKIMKLSDIESCEHVRNRWWYGWGVRYVHGSGLMFNVSGLDAVELTLKDGKKFRIGTDEPAKLIEAIKAG